MVIQSIYRTMNDDASRIPDGINRKLIFRHSFRNKLHGVKNHDEVLLNQEGERAAFLFGKGISATIGQMHSSYIPRCVQTLEYINMGKNQHIPIMVSEDILGNGFTMNKKIADQSFKSVGSLKKVVQLLMNDIPVDGFYPIRHTTKTMLDYIFSTGNEVDKLDLYCTHDFHIALVISQIFDLRGLDEIISQWPNMLEGFFVWGTREDFRLLWRGKSVHIVKR